MLLSEFGLLSLFSLMVTTQQQANDRPTTGEEVELLRGSVQATVIAQFVVAIAAAVG